MTFVQSIKELFDVRDVAGTVYEHVGVSELPVAGHLISFD